MSDEWEKRIDAVAQGMEGRWKTIAKEDALRIARKAFEAGKRAAFAEAAKAIGAENWRRARKYGDPYVKVDSGEAIEILESLAKEPGK